MPVSNPIKRSRLTAAVMIAVGLALLAPIFADLVFPKPPLRQGIVTTKAQCEALPSAVWLTMQDRNFCIRYYLSTAGGEGARAVVFLEGDRTGGYDPRANVFREESGKPLDISPEQFEQYAEYLSERNARPGIYLARIGLDGSSGDHSLANTVLELHVTNAALDAIKQRHKFEGFHLVGQSGGASLTAGLVALRSDVGCAVLGSGRLVKPNGRWMDKPTGQVLLTFNPADAALIIAQRRNTRILLVTDPEDRRVKDNEQTLFMYLVRQAGGQAEQFLVQATDDERHGVTSYSHAVMKGCVRGESAQEIGLTLTYLVAKRLADKAKMNQLKTAE